MAILDLQGMEAQSTRARGGGKSSSSKSCGGGGWSSLSVALC